MLTPRIMSNHITRNIWIRLIGCIWVPEREGFNGIGISFGCPPSG